MTWNYRVIRSEQDGWIDYAIHEVYYGPRGDIDCWSVDSCPAHGETLAELSDDLDRMRRALDKPILEEHNGKLLEGGAG